MTLRIGVRLPVRELKDDRPAICEFAALAGEPRFTHDHRVLSEEGHLGA